MAYIVRDKFTLFNNGVYNETYIITSDNTEPDKDIEIGTKVYLIQRKKPKEVMNTKIGFFTNLYKIIRG